MPIDLIQSYILLGFKLKQLYWCEKRFSYDEFDNLLLYTSLVNTKSSQFNELVWTSKFPDFYITNLPEIETYIDFLCALNNCRVNDTDL